ncbi:MAG: hypothetical protein ACHP84_20240 [Caulobacterales bacterium]
MTDLAEDRSSLATGWHDRRRAWRVEDDGPIGTLLSLGICELDGVIRGERGAFLEMFEAIGGPAQVVFIGDERLAPAARVLADQIRRTDADRAAMAQDLAETFPGGAATPSGADWMFAGAALNALQASPITDRYQILTRNSLRVAGPPDAIILSLNAEPQTLLRHRRLGYTVHFHSFRMMAAGPALVPWLRANFEPVRHTVDNVRADYDGLIDLIHSAAPTAQILVCNVMSTLGYEDIQVYSAFDSPMSGSLSSVRAKDLNLMLHDLARERDVAIVDADAIAADLGARVCMLDAVHQSGAMQAEVRAEILRILRERGVPGFASRPVS